MDKKQYNNIIDWTQKIQPETQTEDSLTAIRAVCNNMGVALPQGDLAQVAETLATDDYMYWHSCTPQEAQEAANNGVPTIGISEDSIVLLAATDEEQPVATTATVMTLANNENNNVTNMAYYSYNYNSTGQNGCGEGNSCYHSNSLFNCNDRTALLNDLIAIVGNRQDILSKYTTTECVDIILNYDSTITYYCNLYCVPKELVQTLLLRELWCVDLTDTVADEAVKAYFRWKEECENWSNLSLAEQLFIPFPEAPLVMREDCSTGLGQMFAWVAIDANNLARNKGFISTRAYNKDDWHDCKEVWFSLHNNDTFAIKMTTLEMYHCADYAGVCGSLFHCTESQIKAILARYNGTGSDATNYGNECYEYYKIFEKYS